MGSDRIRRKGESAWRINGEPFVHRIRTSFAEVAVRLFFRNHSDQDHVLHLYWQNIELTDIARNFTFGIMKDMVMIKPEGTLR